jgi:hypothetical protein
MRRAPRRVDAHGASAYSSRRPTTGHRRSGAVRMGSVIKKRRKKMRKHKYKKLLKRSRHKKR